MSGVHLLIIDPQNDFCDLPADRVPGWTTPALPVPGAHRDMLRLASWLDERGQELDAVTVTLDHHHRRDIAHPGFWRTPEGGAVLPFTAVAAVDLERGRIETFRAEDRERALAYLCALEAAGRFTHMVWPVHCQIGTWGQCVHADLQAALDRWEDRTGRVVHHVLKGENPWTEHYSALRAEIPVADDPATELNTALLEHLQAFDRVLVTGEAGSHCVRATVEHMLLHWNAPVDRISLVRDAMSPVAGFEATQREFLEGATARGARVVDFAAALG
jgi:nicotinamidase-related amidase